jgi:hypothetical protein
MSQKVFGGAPKRTNNLELVAQQKRQPFPAASIVRSVKRELAEAKFAHHPRTMRASVAAAARAP